MALTRHVAMEITPAIDGESPAVFCGDSEPEPGSGRGLKRPSARCSKPLDRSAAFAMSSTPGGSSSPASPFFAKPDATAPVLSACVKERIVAPAFAALLAALAKATCLQSWFSAGHGIFILQNARRPCSNSSRVIGRPASESSSLSSRFFGRALGPSSDASGFSKKRGKMANAAAAGGRLSKRCPLRFMPLSTICSTRICLATSR
mmetsp:Transcript_43301/g.135545  ORF Transcript_43301/g.135545 Transcript_43301/m.135545 type:complete len:205 (+) Transcript_43301:2210-2824(+)